MSQSFVVFAYGFRLILACFSCLTTCVVVSQTKLYRCSLIFTLFSRIYWSTPVRYWFKFILNYETSIRASLNFWDHYNFPCFFGIFDSANSNVSVICLWMNLILRISLKVILSFFNWSWNILFYLVFFSLTLVFETPFVFVVMVVSWGSRY